MASGYREHGREPCPRPQYLNSHTQSPYWTGQRQMLVPARKKPAAYCVTASAGARETPRASSARIPVKTARRFNRLRCMRTPSTSESCDPVRALTKARAEHRPGETAISSPILCASFLQSVTRCSGRHLKVNRNSSPALVSFSA